MGIFSFLSEAQQKPASANEPKKDIAQQTSHLKASDVKDKGDAPKQHVGKVDGENTEEGKKDKEEENEVKEEKTSEAIGNSHHKDAAGEKKKDDDAMESDHEKEAVEEESDQRDAETKKRLGVKKAMGRQGQDNVRGFKLSKHPSCQDDVKQLCSNLPKENNFAILVCLQDSAAVSYMNLHFF